MSKVTRERNIPAVEAKEKIIAALKAKGVQVVEYNPFARPTKEQIGMEVVDFLAEYCDDIPQVLNVIEKAEKDSVLSNLIHSGYLKLYNPKFNGESLVFAYNRYLHWFRGYYYQLSETNNGVGAVNNTFRLDVLVKAVDDGLPDKLVKEIKAFCTVLSAYTTGLYCYRQMNDIKENPEEFNKMLQCDAKKHGYKEDISIQDVLQFERYEQYSFMPEVAPDSKTILLKQKDDKVPFALIEIPSTGDRIKLICHRDNVYDVDIFKIPSWVEGVYIEDNDESQKWDILSPGSRKYFYEAILEFLLNFAAIKANYNVMYPLIFIGNEVFGIKHSRSECVSKFSDAAKFVVDAFAELNNNDENRPMYEEVGRGDFKLRDSATETTSASGKKGTLEGIKNINVF